jgi:UDP-N-acetylglucosamine 4,6-dehydratase
MGSRGSVIPLFRALSERGEPIPITSAEMTRFWITLDQAVEFVIDCLEWMEGGEVFVPKIPSMHLTNLAAAVAPDAEWKYVGIRPGEKLHEVMVPPDDARNTIEYEDRYVIYPPFPFWNVEEYKARHPGGVPMREGEMYSSDTNDRWLSIEQIRDMLPEVETHAG